MTSKDTSLEELAALIKSWGIALGFQQVGITDTNLSSYRKRFAHFLKKNFHGSMHYLEKHGDKRFVPEALVPGTVRVITVRLDYLPPDTDMIGVLNHPKQGYISRYALGRDYHKIMRKRLSLLAAKINEKVNGSGGRAFCDSAPVLEKPLAEKAGLGWIGKHTNLIHPKSGSWFFLGEIYINLPLPIDVPLGKSHCGSCQACLNICPTKAIIAPYQLDARLCISYLTIESKAAIPVNLRPLIGNRIYGCDDCQLICPWNKFAKHSKETAFHPRAALHSPRLLDLFSWSEETFLKQTEGSAIRRIGHEAWLRNIAVALGNAPYDEEILIALQLKWPKAPPLVAEHISWAITSQLASSGKFKKFSR